MKIWVGIEAVELTLPRFSGYHHVWGEFESSWKIPAMDTSLLMANPRLPGPSSLAHNQFYESLQKRERKWTLDATVIDTLGRGLSQSHQSDKLRVWGLISIWSDFGHFVVVIDFRTFLHWWASQGRFNIWRMVSTVSLRRFVVARGGQIWYVLECVFHSRWRMICNIGRCS